MKRLLQLMLLLITAFQGFSQTRGISYQAVILSPQAQEIPGVNAQGNMLANTAISIQFTVINSSNNEEYQEKHRTRTDSYGMINLLIGNGTPTGSKDFSDILWNGTIKKLKVGIDFTGDNNFSPLSEQNLTYMPQPPTQETTQLIDNNAAAIEAEKARAMLAEQTNTTAIATEKTRATTAEQANTSAIEAEKTRAILAEQTNATAIATEKARATTAEQANTAAIEAEKARAIAAEEVNTTTTALNTAKVGITTAQASEIAANTAKVGITTTQATAITNNSKEITTFQGEQTTQNTAIALNTAKVGITTAQASEIAANTAKVGITTTLATAITNNSSAITTMQGEQTTQNTAIAFNTAKVGITTSQASEIAANTLKTGITAQQASDITANNAKVGITTSQTSEIAANTLKVGITTAEQTKLAGIEEAANNYIHPIGDGNLHVPATGTTNNGKFLIAGATAGSLSWITPSIQWITSGTDIYYNSGKVGIGTTTPTKPFQVVMNSAFNGVSISGGGTYGTQLRMGSESSNADARNWGIAVDRGIWGALGFYVSSVAQGDPEELGAGTPAMWISKEKNMALGLAPNVAPVYKLDVVGDVNVTGNYKKNGVNINMGLTNFTESNYVYNTKTGVKLLATNAATNVDVVLNPKGIGALLAQQPDGTTAGGNNRGTYAVDFQMERSLATQVASGGSAVIVGGFNNTASGWSSFVGGGNYNIASGDRSFVGGGAQNKASASTSFVGSGQNNTASNIYSFVGSGGNNTASGDRSFVGAGQSNTASGIYSFVGSGLNNTAQSYGETVFGLNATLGDGTAASFVNADRLFVIGNGFTDANRSNALTILKNANTTVGGSLTVNGNGSNTSFALPAGRGATGQVLTTDGAGVTSWASAAADGSETKVTAGTNVTVTGTGTTASPYVVNATGVTTLTIGQSYQGGKIFWLDATGQHGLIAATADQSEGIKWSNGFYKFTGSEGDGLYAGAMNTAMIVAQQMASNPTENFAAKLCADYSVNVGDITYGDWYLPSNYELTLLNAQIVAVGGFAGDYYWSSTEYTGEGSRNDLAWSPYLPGAFQGTSDKETARRVRAIRAF